MKKLLCLFLTLILLFTLFCSCDSTEETDVQTNSLTEEEETMLLDALKIAIYEFDDPHSVEILNIPYFFKSQIKIKIKYLDSSKWYALNISDLDEENSLNRKGKLLDVSESYTDEDAANSSFKDFIDVAKINEALKAYLNDPNTPSVDEVRVQRVEDMIDEIDAYASDLDTKQKIQTAEEAYNRLSQENQGKVSNYAALVKAKVYNIYWKSQEAAVKEAQSDIKSKLLNPASLQVHSAKAYIYYDPSDFCTPLLVEVDVDYSAQNRMGGYTRESAVMCYEFNVSGYLINTTWGDIMDAVGEKELKRIAAPIDFGMD